ncbi:MAG: DUF294 nucleotidyltransferase-like domain-containing protein [Bacteroidales bacterium]
MAPAEKNKYIISIVLPSVLAVVLFVCSFYLVLVPLFENSMMDRKKEMISELTNTALSLVNDYNADYRSGILSEEEARHMAAERVGKMRYGDDRKDYFWITDMRPYMVMHPYRPELNGTDLSDYTDPDGKKLFVESAAVVKEKGEGFIDYKWQWKDDTTQIVPKLSYVKGFDEWNWIIGTGIYLDDVKKEIRTIERGLLWISFAIIMVIALVLAYINRQSMIIERRRREAEQELLLSRQKYKSLVEASSEGTIMIMEGKIVYVNQKFLDLAGAEREEVSGGKFEDIFDMKWTDITDAFTDPGKSVNFETGIKGADDTLVPVIVSTSRVRHNDNFGYILIVKELGKSDILNKEKESLHHDMQTSLLLMNRQIGSLAVDFVSCETDTTIAEAARLMMRKKQEVVFVKQKGQVIGVTGRKDLLNRQLAEDLDNSAPVTRIMSAPVISLPADSPVYEAIIECRTRNISHILVRNKEGDYTGVISYKQLLEAQQNHTGVLTGEIRRAESIDDMIPAYQRMNVLVEAFVESGVKTESITRVISGIADAVTKRIAELVIEEEGEPPCDFCFIAMGSQGRSEQTLVTDQDNGIITGDSCKDDDRAEEYFVRLGKKINKGLDRVGYNYCPGNFMAGNPEWNMCLGDWKKVFSGWINNSDPQSLLDISIFFDFRAVYGESSLADSLRQHVNKAAEDKAVFFFHLSQTLTRFKPPVGMFGQIVGEHDSPDSNIVDVKKLLMPVSGFARIYALKLGIAHTGTILRLESIKEAGVVQEQLLDEIIQSYKTLMTFRLSKQVKQVMEGGDPGNALDVNRLTDIEKSTLKKVLSVINDIMITLKSDFKGSV